MKRNRTFQYFCTGKNTVKHEDSSLSTLIIRSKNIQLIILQYRHIVYFNLIGEHTQWILYSEVKILFIS
jgi:hypothetical protein